MKLEKTDLTASNGLLKLRVRRSIVFNEISGEAKEKGPATVREYRTKAGLCEGHADKDIFDGDETGLFLRLLKGKSPFEKK